MKGKWEVSSQCVNGEWLYIVYRLRNTAEVDHSGNREFYGSYTTDEKAAEDLAAKLNAEGADETNVHM